MHDMSLCYIYWFRGDYIYWFRGDRWIALREKDASIFSKSDILEELVRCQFSELKAEDMT